MTPKKVKLCVGLIIDEFECTLDNEKAHIHEDNLMENVLIAIANGAKNPELLAKEALKMAAYSYTRYYA